MIRLAYLPKLFLILPVIGLLACNPGKKHQSGHADPEDPPQDLVATTTWSGPAEGGIIDGNGGDIVSCPNSQPAMLGKKAMVLDRYEALRLGYPTALGDSLLDVEAKVALALKRIAELDPSRFADLTERYETFKQRSAILPNLSLPQLPDEGVVHMPDPSCHVENIAFQYAPKASDDPIYYIKAEFWNLLDNDERAILILHELAYNQYREQSRSAALSSRGVRNFTSALIGDAFAPMTKKEYATFLREKASLLPYLKVGNLSFALDSVGYFPSGQVSHGTLLLVPPATSVRIGLQDQDPGVSTLGWKPGNEVILQDGTMVAFYEDGRLKRAFVHDSIKGTLWRSRKYDGSVYGPVLNSNCPPLSGDGVPFHVMEFGPDGTQTSIAPVFAMEWPLCAVLDHGATEPIMTDGFVDFHANGVIAKASYLDRGGDFVAADGTKTFVYKGSEIEFDANGWFVSARSISDLFSPGGD